MGDGQLLGPRPVLLPTLQCCPGLF